jgi:hypothetical protein
LIKIIKPRGVDILITDRAGAPSPDQLYGWMECDIIIMPRLFFICGQCQQFFVDEQGLRTGKDINHLATELYHDGLALDPRGERVGERILYGNVVILTKPNFLDGHRKTHIHAGLLRPRSAML